MEPISGDPPVARHVRIGYNFWGTARELRQTFSPEPEEIEVAFGAIRAKTLGFLDRLAMLLLINRRLRLVLHYPFKADEGYEFPKGSLIRLEPAEEVMRILYRDEQGESHIEIQERMLLGMALKQAWGTDTPEGADLPPPR